jgi:hypothetical protein
MNDWLKIEVGDWEWKIVLKKEWVRQIERSVIENLVKNLGEEIKLVQLNHSKWWEIIIILRFVNRLPENIKYLILLEIVVDMIKEKAIE